MLHLPDFKERFFVEIDASADTMGAILMQGERPIAYFNKQLAPSFRKSSAYIHELVVVIEVVKRWSSPL